MKKDFLQPKIELIYLNDMTVLMTSCDNNVDFPDDPRNMNGNSDL